MNMKELYNKILSPENKCYRRMTMSGIVIGASLVVLGGLGSYYSHMNKQDLTAIPIMAKDNLMDTYSEWCSYKMGMTPLSINAVSRDYVSSVAEHVSDYENCCFDIETDTIKAAVRRDGNYFQGTLSHKNVVTDGGWQQVFPFYAKKQELKTIVYIECNDLWYQLTIDNEQLPLYDIDKKISQVNELRFEKLPTMDLNVLSGRGAITLYYTDDSQWVINDCGHIQSINTTKSKISNIGNWGQVEIATATVPGGAIEVSDWSFLVKNS